MCLVAQHGIVPAAQPKQARRTDHEPDAANRPQQDNGIRERVGRGRAEAIVVDGCQRRRGEAEQETVEREVMEPAPQPFGRMVEARPDITALAASLEVLESQSRGQTCPFRSCTWNKWSVPGCGAKAQRTDRHREDREEKG